MDAANAAQTLPNSAALREKLISEISKEDAPAAPIVPSAPIVYSAVLPGHPIQLPAALPFALLQQGLLSPAMWNALPPSIQAAWIAQLQAFSAASAAVASHLPMQAAPSPSQPAQEQNFASPLAPVPTIGLPAVALERAKRGPRRKRARIIREGQLTMIVYGANEALTWARRVSHFQGVMRGVLGDRRRTFTWSGSVTDSIVGAFLTQNVSDGLSSRAFMEVVSRWPAKSPALTSGCLPPHHHHEVTADSADWEAVRLVPQEDLANTIKCRGMHTILSANIQAFLNHLRHYNLHKGLGPAVAAAAANFEIQDDVLAAVESMMGAIEDLEDFDQSQDSVELVMEDLLESLELETTNGQGGSAACTRREHMELCYEGEGSSPVKKVQVETKDRLAAALLSSEWLREAPDDEARDFLMGINGLGRKSVACIMLLTLGKKEFPVDTNVGRICSRLGWIPLDSQEAIEDLDDYAPEPEVHAYLRSRLLGFNIETLYELHYQMITLGKVFCSKHNPNCRACPMQKDCEYAMHNGPSLHGRKKIKVNHSAGMVDGDAGQHQAAFGSDRDTYYPPNGNLSQGYNSSINGAPNSAYLESVPGEKRVHWRTLQKLERIAREKEERELARLEHGRRYSILSIDELAESRRTRPRTQGLRKPRGSTSIDDPIPFIKRLETEMRVLADPPKSRHLLLDPNFRWLPIETMRLAAQGKLPPSMWDSYVAKGLAVEGSVEEKTAVSAAGLQCLLEEAQAMQKEMETESKARLESIDVLQMDNNAANMPSVWDLADQPLPPRCSVYEEPPLPPIVVKAKPVAVEETITLKDLVGGDSAGIGAGVTAQELAQAVDGNATAPLAAAPMELPLEAEPAIEFVPDEEMLAFEEAAETAAAMDVVEGLLRDWTLGAVGCEGGFDATELDPENSDEIPGSESVVEPEASHLPQQQHFAALDIEFECQRLQQLAEELASENEAMAKVPQGGDCSTHRKRLLELSLQALNIDLSSSVQSVDSVLTTSRSNYRRLAKALHPDKCKLPGAVDAFSGLGIAMNILSEHSCTVEDPPASESFPSGSTAPLPFGGTASDHSPPEHRIVWNSSRLVVNAHILSGDIHRNFPHLTPDGVEMRGQIMFLPIDNIPTFQREQIAGRFQPSTAITTTGTRIGVTECEITEDASVAAAVEIEEGELCDGGSSDGEMVSGMLLITCRAALRGRFPLNGTYFQINEVFVDHTTAMQPVQLSRAQLDESQLCAIYFGLGIHYMSKAMTQEEVTFMFSDGWVCFRAFDPQTRAPMLLPHFLMPSVPSPNAKSSWKNKKERLALKAEKEAAKAAALVNLQPASQLGNSPVQQQPSQLRLLRVPLSSEDGIAPSPTPDSGSAGYVDGIHASSLFPATPPPKKKRKYKIHTKNSEHGGSGAAYGKSYADHRPGQPKTQEAADAKSGKGQPRRRSFGPIIRASQKCGMCKPCLNPGWKKPCETRRAEMIAQQMQLMMQQAMPVEASAAVEVAAPLPLPSGPPHVHQDANT